MHVPSDDGYKGERTCLFFLIGCLTYVVDFSFGRSIGVSWRSVQTYLRLRALR